MSQSHEKALETSSLKSYLMQDSRQVNKNKAFLGRLRTIQKMNQGLLAVAGANS